MLKVAVLVSGGGTNLQAILDAIDNGTITNAKVEVVISNNKNAYALERAKNHGIEALCISPKDYGTRDAFNKAFLEKLDDCQPDLIVLAGFLVVIPKQMIEKYRNRIINIHPSLIPSFCGTGYYGLKVHEGVLSRGVKENRLLRYTTLMDSWYELRGKYYKPKSMYTISTECQKRWARKARGVMN